MSEMTKSEQEIKDLKKIIDFLLDSKGDSRNYYLSLRDHNPTIFGWKWDEVLSDPSGFISSHRMFNDA